MIILECEQTSPEWEQARLGIPTASEFSKIVSPTGKASTQATVYMNKLLAEWLSGKAQEHYTNGNMDHGHEVEDEARDYLEFQTDLEIKKVGFVYMDERRLVGISPDGLIEPTAGCEIKCPMGSTQIKYLLANKHPTEYVPQVQGSLWVTGREHWKFISYHKDLPPLILHVERDEKYIKTLSTMVNNFIGKMLEKREKLIEMGFEPAEIKEAA